MNLRFPALGFVLAIALVMPACSGKPESYLSDDGKRKEAIEVLVSNHSMRQEVIDRLIGPPIDRAAVIERILSDDDASGHLIQKILEDERGKALVASQVAANSDPKTFIRMLMLTGVMGESMTQKQAKAIGLGNVFAYGNQRKTMVDLRKAGEKIDAWSKNRGRYPVCAKWGAVETCVGKQMAEGSFDGLRLTDAWGNTFHYHSDADGREYILVSYASDGEYDGLGKVGPTNSFDCDIVFSNGDFIQWPGYMRKNDIR